MKKSKKKVKVRDMKPKKDAKGGGGVAGPGIGKTVPTGSGGSIGKPNTN